MKMSVLRQRALTIIRKPLTKRFAIGFGIFLLLFGIFGYFFLPGIIKTKIEEQLTDKFHRPTTIEKISINPYALALNIHKLKALEPDGKKTFISFDKLRINISMQSLFRFAPVVSELKLDKPYVHLVRRGKNQYSIDDILKIIAEQPKSDKPSRYAVYNIQIEGGGIEFEDQPKNTQHTVTDLKIGIPFISSLPSQVDVFVEPFLNANINGSNMQVKGKTLPFSETRETIVNLDFDDVNLTKYLGYLPFKPKFKVNDAKLSIHIAANFKQSQDLTRALVLKGNAALKDVDITDLSGDPMIKLPELSLVLGDMDVFSSKLNLTKISLTNPELSIVRSKSGSLNLAHLSPPTSGKNKRPAKTDTALKIALNEFVVRGGKVDFHDYKSAQAASGKLGKFNLSVKNSEIDLLNKDIAITEISTNSADFDIQHQKSAKITKPETDTENTSKVSEPGWDITVGKVAVSNWSAQFEDKNLRRRRVTQVAPISLTARNLSTKQGQKGELTVEATFDKTGVFKTSGAVGLSPMHADQKLDLKNVSILPAQPFFSDKLNLLFARANLYANGSLQLDENRNGALKGGFKGSVALTQVATVDKVSANNFVSWRNLSFRGINTQFEPFSLYISRILLDRYYARVIVSPEGRINLQDVIRGPGEEAKSLTKTAKKIDNDDEEESPKPAPAPVSSQENAVKDVPPIKIGKLTLKRGRVRFTDQFIKPNYTANMVDLGGTITDMSSKADTAAAVDLDGSINSAPLTIKGAINPLKGDLFLDLKGNVNGMELAPLSAYSGKYAGYGIEKGKLSFDVAYKVDQRKLSAENHLILDQLTFGQKVDSPSATKLPVMLAVALLRDRNGVIDLRVPISGSLDDPKFSVGGIIVKAFFNLIAKAITSPFALLGSIFGGGEDLSWLNFEPGIAKISANAETKLVALSKALIDRPGLKLEIKGLADPATDRVGMAQESIARKVRLLKKKDMISDGIPIPPEGIVVSEKEYPDLLKRVYADEDFERPRNFIGFLKSLPVPEMEKLMLANAKVTDDDLLNLGTERAQAVKEWLIAKKVPAERIYIVASKLSSEKDKQGPNRVDFSLK